MKILTFVTKNDFFFLCLHQGLSFYKRSLQPQPFFFVGHFCLPRSVSGSTDPIESNLDVKHWVQAQWWRSLHAGHMVSTYFEPIFCILPPSIGLDQTQRLLAIYGMFRISQKASHFSHISMLVWFTRILVHTMTGALKGA